MSLVENLEQRVCILRLDPSCQWRTHFESCLKEGRELLEAGFSQDDLNSFSNSVTHVYGGAGSFDDYAPGIYEQKIGRITIIPGMEAFDEAFDKAYEAAVALRVIGQTAP